MSKNSITEYTENEFLALLQKIFNADFTNEKEEEDALHHFVKISEHPSKYSLILSPASRDVDSPEAVLQIVKEWRASNGKPGFKTA